MPATPPLHEVRCCVCGESGMGKTTLLHRYVRNKFDPDIESTIGAAYMCRTLGPSCRLHLWDTAGQERYEALCPMYLRNADIALVCVEAARVGTPRGEAAARRWASLAAASSPAAVVVLVATKADLLPAAGLYRARAALAELAARLGARHHHLVSSKSSEGCAEFADAIDTLALDIAPRRPPRDTIALPEPSEQGPPLGGCCW